MVAGVQASEQLKKMGMASLSPPPPFFCGFGSNRSAEKDRLG